MLKVTNLKKTFGTQIILNDISFHINPGERTGLVGRNGHGKTTLFRMIIGEESLDSGKISIPKNYTLGYVTQKIQFTKDTIIEEACLGLADEHKDEKWKAEKILFGLGFNNNDMNRHPSEFSGGFHVRLNLAKVLVSEPNLLLLDEPTNYLDIVSIRWLSNYLKLWKDELILITHDRGFMDSIITDTIGIHRTKIKKVNGTTDKLYNQLLKEEETHEKTRINDAKKRKETELFITRFRAKARLAGLVQSRIKNLQKRDRLEKLEKIKTLDFSFSYKPTPAKVLMSISGLSFSYDKSEPPLINDLSFSISRNDRICVIGRNGKGKTTLLKILAQELSPDNGKITTHPATAIDYFAQTNTVSLNDSISIEQEIMNSGCDRQKARDISGAMMFEGDMALKKIEVISGGEKSRVLLGKILATPANLLLLDEPTNHLDMEACDTFMAAIDNFDGAVIIVTHNEMFLHTLATKFIIFQQDNSFLFEGSYQRFLEKVGWEEEDIKTKRNDNRSALDENNQIINKKDIRKLKADIQRRRSKSLTLMKNRISEIEQSVEKREEKLEKQNNEMIEASAAGDGKKISSLSKEIHRSQIEINSLFEEYETLVTQYDEKKKEFEQEMIMIEGQIKQGLKGTSKNYAIVMMQNSEVLSKAKNHGR
jgi:ATP-binding cassette subfamily F protein 3